MILLILNCLEFPSQKPFLSGNVPIVVSMALDSEEFVISLPFAQALKSAFAINEAKIISAISFDVIGIIPHLSESGIMEPNLRKLLIERNLVCSAKSRLVLQRIHEMDAIGYVRFVVLLQRNQSDIVYRKLADHLLVAAQELYESWRCGLYSCRHLHTSEGSVSRQGVKLCSSVQTASVTKGLWIPCETATVQPDSYHLTDAFKTLPHGTSSRQHPVHQHHPSLRATSDQFTPIPGTDSRCDTVTLSVMCFSEENVCILVQRFCESGGSQMERVGKLLKMVTIPHVHVASIRPTSIRMNENACHTCPHSFNI